MTKEDFLNQLSNNLQNIPEKDYDEIMAYFTEYFQEAGPDNEDKVIQDLGNPEEIASEIISSLGISKQSSENDWTNWDTEDNFDNQSNEWSTQILAPITELNFQLYNLNIEVYLEPISQPTLTYFDDGNLTITQTSDGYLKLNEQTIQKEQSHIFHSLFLIGKMLTKRKTITLILPEGTQLQTIVGISNNGDVQLSQISASKISLNSYNGNIKLDHLENAIADIKSKNGDLQLTNCLLDNCKLETKNAGLICQNSQISNAIVLNKNGNTKFEDGTLQQANIENKNGNILINHTILNGKTSIDNKNGVIDIRLTAENLSRCQVQSQNKNGFTNISRDAGKDFPTQAHLKLKNKNGMINLQ